MKQTGGPQHDEPSGPQTAVPMWVAPAKPRENYPPGFEPGAPEENSAWPAGTDPRRGHAQTKDAAAPRQRTVGHRPVVAGVVGGALIALLGLGGMYVVGNLTGGHDGDQFSTQGISHVAPPGDEDADSHESETDT